MKCEPLDIALTVEEIGMDGEICLGRCSHSTAYRDVKRINEYLTENRYDWRVKLTIDKTSSMPYSLVKNRKKGADNEAVF